MKLLSDVFTTTEIKNESDCTNRCTNREIGRMIGPRWHVLTLDSDLMKCRYCGKPLSQWDIFESCPSRKELV